MASEPRDIQQEIDAFTGEINGFIRATDRDTPGREIALSCLRGLTGLATRLEQLRQAAIALVGTVPPSDMALKSSLYDILPREGITPGSLEGARRWAAWMAGERHRDARGADSPGPRLVIERWDETDWQVAQRTYQEYPKAGI